MRRGPGAGIEKETQGMAKPTLESRCFRQARRPCRQYVDLPRRRRHLLPQSLFTIRYFRELVNPGGGKKFSAPGGTAAPAPAPTPAPADRLRSRVGGEKNGTFFQPSKEACQRGNCPSTAETFASGMEKFRFFAKRPKFSEHDFHFCWKRKKQKTLRTKRQDFLENLCRCAKILTFNDRPKAAASGQTYDLRSGKKWIT